MCRIFLDLFSQPSDMNSHCGRITEFPTQNFLREPLPAKCLTGMDHQVNKQVKLSDRQRRWLAAEGHGAADDIDFRVAR